MITAYTYKLNPSKAQQQELGNWIDMLRSAYNFNLRERSEAYSQVRSPMMGNYSLIEAKAECCPLSCSVSKGALHGSPWTKAGKSRSAGAQQDACLPALKESRPWYKRINADVLQMNIRRLNEAFTRFWSGQNSYPKPKNRSKFKSFSYKPGQVKISGKKIYLPGIGWMKFFSSRETPVGYSIRTATVRKKAKGWWVSIRLEDKSVPAIPIKHPSEVKFPLGVDLGINKLASLSNGEFIANPRFAKKMERRKALRQRRVNRKQKGSKNRRRAALLVSRLDQKVEQQRNDFGWKVAHHLNRLSDCIIFEDLNIKGMVKRCKPKKNDDGKFIRNGQAAKSGLNKAILDAGWGGVIQKTKAVAAKLGNIVWQINPQYSSQECPCCGFISPNNRDKEKFLCESCGHFDDADTNASINIVYRGCIELDIRLVQSKFMPLEISPLIGAGELGNTLISKVSQVTVLSSRNPSL